MSRSMRHSAFDITADHSQAGGNVGKFMTEQLLKTGKHTITALTRAEGQSTLQKASV